jgi:hypothetical protein
MRVEEEIAATLADVKQRLRGLWKKQLEFNLVLREVKGCIAFLCSFPDLEALMTYRHGSDLQLSTSIDDDPEFEMTGRTGYGVFIFPPEEMPDYEPGTIVKLDDAIFDRIGPMDIRRPTEEEIAAHERNGDVAELLSHLRRRLLVAAP